MKKIILFLYNILNNIMYVKQTMNIIFQYKIPNGKKYSQQMAKKIIYADDGDSFYFIWLIYGKFKMKKACL